MKKSWLFLMVLFCLTLVVTSSNFAAKKHIVIGNIITSAQQEWNGEVVMGMQQAAKDLHVKVLTASSDYDAAREADICDQFIGQKVDAIAFNSANADASVPAFERICAAKIPVVCWDKTISSKNMRYFVGVDNVTLGRVSGRYVVKYIKAKMGGKAKMAIINNLKYTPGIARMKGFSEEIKKLPGIKVVAVQDARLREEALPVLESILQAHPDVEIVWAWNQGSVLGALAALKNNKKGDSIKLVGIDMSIDLAKEMLIPGTPIAAITTQQPLKIGYKTIEACVNLIKGKKVKNKILVPFYTLESEDKAACQEYLTSRNK
jgi:ABC-type sugar transport system substrate-binding protein